MLILRELSVTLQISLTYIQIAGDRMTRGLKLRALVPLLNEH